MPWEKIQILTSSAGFFVLFFTKVPQKKHLTSNFLQSFMPYLDVPGGVPWNESKVIGSVGYNPNILHL